MSDDKIEDVPVGLDYSFEVMSVISEILYQTISRGIDEERKGDELPIPKEMMIKKILAMNLEKFDEDCNVTLGPDGKIYLAGSWLMRPVLYNNRMIPMMFFLEESLDLNKIEMIAEKTGSQLRKELWKDILVNGKSFDLPKSARLQNQMDAIELPMLRPKTFN